MTDRARLSDRFSAVRFESCDRESETVVGFESCDGESETDRFSVVGFESCDRESETEQSVRFSEERLIPTDG